MTETYLTRLSLDRRATIRAAARGRANSADPGYLLHSALSLVFATSSEPAAVPFSCFAWDDIRERNMSWYERDRTLPVLAYAPVSAQALRARVGNDGLVRSIESKVAPRLSAGSRCDYRVRVCPVVRTRRDRDGASQGRGAKSRELDAFTHANLDGEPVSREEAYGDWLQARLAGAAEVHASHLSEFRTDRMHRKGGPPFAHPNALLEGSLTVADEDRFGDLLARGIGRHRAFGFGMLLLRPAR